LHEFFEKFHFVGRPAREHPLPTCPPPRTESAPNRASKTADSSQGNQARSVAVELPKAEAFTSRWIDLARGTWANASAFSYPQWFPLDRGDCNAMARDAHAVAETHIHLA
jgi:hypothetical protein